MKISNFLFQLNFPTIIFLCLLHSIKIMSKKETDTLMNDIKRNKMIDTILINYAKNKKIIFETGKTIDDIVYEIMFYLGDGTQFIFDDLINHIDKITSENTNLIILFASLKRFLLKKENQENLSKQYIERLYKRLFKDDTTDLALLNNLEQYQKQENQENLLNHILTQYSKNKKDIFESGAKLDDVIYHIMLFMKTSKKTLFEAIIKSAEYLKSNQIIKDTSLNSLINFIKSEQNIKKLQERFNLENKSQSLLLE